MFTSESYGINSEGHLTIGGADSVRLAEKYGTPLYVMDEDYIRSACRAYRDILSYYCGGSSTVCYASKAFCTKYMYKILREENIYADVVSGGELYTALDAGFPAEHIVMHGNCKTPEEIEYAIDSGVGRIVADSENELRMINDAASKKGKIADIMFRINPGVEAHTHEYIQTGQTDSKFGVDMANGQAFEFVKNALRLDNIRLTGIHCHIGSQIFETEPFKLAAHRMTEFIAQVRNSLGYELAELNLGGGFGIKYTAQDRPPSVEDFISAVAEQINADVKEFGITHPRIMIEPGRSIAAPAGITLYRVGAIKEIPGVRTYVSVDGGMTDNPRYILYQAEYEVLNAARPMDPKDHVYTIAGRNCESGDLIAKNIKTGRLEIGDCAAVLNTGAYNYSMASNYNRVPRPAVVMISGGADKIVVKRESFADLVKNDLL